MAENKQRTAKKSEDKKQTEIRSPNKVNHLNSKMNEEDVLYIDFCFCFFLSSLFFGVLCLFSLSAIQMWDKIKMNFMKFENSIKYIESGLFVT